MKNPHHEFTVKGHGAFPTDMLRYDRAWPADGAAVDGLTYPRVWDDDGYSEVRDVRLRTSEARNVTAARWASFGWHVQ